MKKTLFLFAFLFFTICYSNAQPEQEKQPRKPPTVEDRLKHVSEKLDEELKLTPDQKEKILAAFKTFFADMEANRSKQAPPPPPPPPVKKEIAEKLSAERDEKIRKVLTTDQFSKFKEIEKKLRPKHRKEDMPPPPAGE